MTVPVMSFYIIHFRPSNVRKSIVAAVLFLSLSISLFGCATTTSTDRNSDGSQITVEGRAVVMGNVPFARLILETKDRNSYILEMDGAMRDSLMTPAQIKVTGKLKVGEWNGRPFAQIKVSELTHVQ